MSSERKIIPIKDSFFNDGYWYVLTSSSLGGRNYGAQEISDKLCKGDADTVRSLVKDGICLPICFPADCALDMSVVLIGDLSEQENQEWLSCMRSKLEIPCGEFMLMGGAMPEHFEASLASTEPGDPCGSPCHKIKVDPGTYLVEVYAFLGSTTVNEAWEEWPYEESAEEWWSRTRPNQESKWIEAFEEEEYVDAEDLGLLEYIIRLSPLTEDVDIPDLDEETNWCQEFKARKPELCPVGLIRDEVIGC